MMPSVEENVEVTVQGRDIPAILRIGDQLNKPVYGKPLGSSRAVLLLAAGQRIETIAQLQRLREAGFEVSLPNEQLREKPQREKAEEAAPPVPKTTAIPPSFAQRLETAQHLRTTLGSAVKALLSLVNCGLGPDLRELVSSSALLANEVAADPYAVAALTHLRNCDDYTVEHSADVGILMVAIGRTLGMDDGTLRELALAGLVHDIGKQRLPDRTLKKQGPLTEEEWTLMRKHPELGIEVLRESMPQCPDSVLQVVRQHHERLDGSGYPNGLFRKDLHPHSLIAAVSDVFDATTADRPYRKARAAREAMMLIYGGRGTHFDPHVVTALIKLVGVYPVGTRVQLDSGEIGTVVAPNPDDSTRPVVEVEQDRYGREVEPFQLSLKGSSTRIVSVA